VKLSGWTVHVGSTAYTSGSIERGGVSLKPYSQVVNDYQTYFGTGRNTSLRFFGGAANPAGRVVLPSRPDQQQRSPVVSKLDGCLVDCGSGGYRTTRSRRHLRRQPD
jgi:hypothetical protein